MTSKIEALDAALQTYLLAPSLQEEKMRFCSLALDALVNETTNGTLSLFEKRWTKLCHKVLQGQMRIASLEQKLLQTVVELQTAVPPKKTATALALFEHLSLDEVKLGLEKILSAPARELLTECPKSLEAAKIMLTRLLKGEYGESVKNSLFTESCPLYHAEKLAYMLFVDLMLHDQNPKGAIEWFSECDEAVIKTIQQELQSYISTLCQKTGLSLKNAHYLLICGKAAFPLITKQASLGYIKSSTFSRVIEHLRVYFQPSTLQIRTIAERLAPISPKSALDIACLIEEQDPLERRQAIAGVLMALPSTEASFVLQYLTSLKKKEPLTYNFLAPRYAIHLVQSGFSDTSWNYLKKLYLGLDKDKSRLEALLLFAKMRSEKPGFYAKKQELFFKLLKTYKSLDDLEPLLDKYLKYEVLERFENRLDAIGSSLDFLQRLKNDALAFLGRSSLVFYSFIKGEPHSFCPEILECFYAIVHPEIRLNTLERIVCHILNEKELEGAIALVSAISQSLQYVDERTHVLKQLVRHVAEIDKALADRLAERIEQPFSRLQARHYKRKEQAQTEMIIPLDSLEGAARTRTLYQ